MHIAKSYNSIIVRSEIIVRNMSILLWNIDTLNISCASDQFQPILIIASCSDSCVPTCITLCISFGRCHNMGVISIDNFQWPGDAEHTFIIIKVNVTRPLNY